MTAASAPVAPKDPYQQAVAAYVQAAEGELKALKAEGEAAHAAAPEGERSKFEPFQTKLKECEQVLAELKAAKQDKFDPTKARYEKTRAELVAALQKVRS